MGNTKACFFLSSFERNIVVSGLPLMLAPELFGNICVMSVFVIFSYSFFFEGCGIQRGFQADDVFRPEEKRGIQENLRCVKNTVSHHE